MMKIKPGIMLYLKYLYPYTSLLLSLPLKWIPLIIRGNAANFGILELTLFTVVFAIPLIKFLRFKLTVNSSEIYFKEGLFITREKRVLNPESAVISIDRGAFTRLLCSAKVKVYSSAGSTNAPIINAYISKRSAMLIQNNLSHNETIAVKRFKFREILVYSLGSSSFIAGVFVAAPFINKVLTITGNPISEIVTNLFGNEQPNLAGIVNMALKLPILVLIVGYTFDFFKTFADMFSFRLTETPNNLCIRRGFIKLHTAFIPKQEICAVVCRQAPLFSALRLKSIAILSNGYGRQISSNDCILPLTNEALHPNILPYSVVLITPHKKAKIRPVKPYLIISCFTLAAIFAAWRFLPSFEILQLLLTAVFFYLLIAAIIRFENYNKCFLILGDILSVKAQHRLSIHEMHLPKSHTAAIKITQTPFDNRFGVCKVQIFAAHKGGVSLKIKNLPANSVIYSVSGFFADD